MPSRLAHVQNHYFTAFLLWNLIFTAIVTCARGRYTSVKWWYFPETTHVIYLDNNDYTVYISYDEGRVFERVSEIPAGHGADLEIHPYDPQSVFVFRGSSVWLTRDSGRSWTQSSLPGYWETLTPLSFHSDPEYSGYILIPLLPNCDWPGRECNFGFYYTKDHFQSVSLLRENTTQCLFAHSSEHFKPAVSKEHIFCHVYDTLSDLSSHVVLQSDTYFSTTDISGSQHPSLDPVAMAVGVRSLDVAGNLMVISIQDRVYSPIDRTKAHFLISTDAVHWTWAEFKPRMEWVKGYVWSKILPVRSDLFGIIASVPPEPGWSSESDLYMWNANLQHFQKTLTHVTGLSMWFGNLNKPFGVNSTGFTYKQMIDPVSPYQTKSGSVATFDGGWTWTTLTVPEAYCNYRRKEPCRLFLFLGPSDMTYSSTPSGHEILIAKGCVGFRCDSSEISSWISRDGGRTWRMFSKRTVIPIFGGSGSVLVMTESVRARHILVSLDYGETFRTHSLNLPPGATLSAALITAANPESLKFLLWGNVFGTSSSFQAHDMPIWIDLSYLKGVEGAFESGDPNNEQKVLEH